jgi:hypothetical protein
VSTHLAILCPSTTPYVYNFVLGADSDSHVLLLNGALECTALGHGLRGPVTWHDFYAVRQHVMDALRACDGQGLEQGFVTVTGSLHGRFRESQRLRLKKIENAERLQARNVGLAVPVL